MAAVNTDTYTEPVDRDSPAMVLASKNGSWSTVWDILDKKPYLVNSIPRERAWGILHQAVWWHNADAVRKMLGIPGCNSELLTKNGLRPLDIETSGEIKGLLRQHIENKEVSKTSFFLSPVELEVPTDGIIPNQLTFEELKEQEQPQLNNINEASKKRDWKKLFSILKFWSHLINLVHPETGLAVIHHAALSGNVKAVIEVLSYEACDPNVKTEKPATVGPGKTAAQITTNEAVKVAIVAKLNEMNKRYNEAPTCVKPEEAQLHLMWYVYGAIQNNTITKDKFNPSYFSSFPEMERHIYDFISTGNNWRQVRDIVYREVYKVNALEANNINDSKSMEAFSQQLLRTYTADGYYLQLNEELRATPLDYNKNNPKFSLYTALTNAVLFHGKCDGLSDPYTKNTYRYMELTSEQLQKYKVGFKFAWLSFTSSSSNENIYFSGKKFIFNNETQCPWSPRGVEKISCSPIEKEYLYPCSAHFEVTKVDGEVIHLKLVNPDIILRPLELIYETSRLKYDGLVSDYNNRYTRILDKKRTLDEANLKLHGLHLEVERNRNYETQVAEHKVKRIPLPRGTMSYHCRECNSTCHYPCVESDMYLDRCVICIPAAEAACTKCRGKCHFRQHARVNYRIEERLQFRNNIDKDMKIRFENTEPEYQAQEAVCHSLSQEFNALLSASPNARDLIGNMQQVTGELSNVIEVNEDNQWSRWNEIVKETCDGRVFVENCRFQMEELGLL